MGEASRRGSYEERRKAAIKRNKDLLVQHMGGRDERLESALQAALAPFLSRMSADEWLARRNKILNYLKAHPEDIELQNALPVRVREDEIGWYLFLCDQTLHDPMCVDISQQQRILPFFVGIGERWPYAPMVKGLEQKIDELLGKYKSSPDGVIFEILVALSYAASGWTVEFIEEHSSIKTPDMVARKEGEELYIECKRQDRRTAYAETERKEFLRIWDAAKHVLVDNRQWVWLKGVFHAEASNLPTEFLENILRTALPIGKGEILIYDSADATIYARQIDYHAVQRHMAQNMVKLNSPMLSSLLGGDWAPENASVTLIHMVKLSHVVDCDVPVLGDYVEDIGWACGFTRDFDSPVSIEKKARDITKYLSEAVKQVPKDKASIIHIAAETLEGKEVELRRTEKVLQTIPSFITDKPVVAVRFHRFQSNQRIDKLYECDETVDSFQIDGVVLDDIPINVLAPNDTKIIAGHHWELYE